MLARTTLLVMALTAGCMPLTAAPPAGQQSAPTETTLSAEIDGSTSLLTAGQESIPTPRVESEAAGNENVTSALVFSTAVLSASEAKTPVVALLPTPTPKTFQPTVALPTPTPKPALTVTPPPLPTPDGIARRVRAPILMYHYLSAPPPDADIYRKDLSVSPELFAAHLDRILAEGYQTVSLYDLLLHLTQGAALPEKPVIITFDDGYRDNYENAFPLLRERGMTATFFVVTDFIDEERPAYLTWEMAREMHNAGMDIESHGRNHVSLKGKDNDYLVWQALGSLETIEYEIGERPRFISYPAGEYDQATIDIFRSANYWAGLTTKQGATHDLDAPFEWRRVRVRGSTTPNELVNLLALDW